MGVAGWRKLVAGDGWQPALLGRVQEIRHRSGQWLLPISFGNACQPLSRAPAVAKLRATPGRQERRPRLGPGCTEDGLELLRCCYSGDNSFVTIGLLDHRT
jgi:hypothetical protein